MSSHHTYEESKKIVFRGMWLLAGVTLLEVLISLFGKGHLIAGVHKSTIVFFITGLVIIGLSLYKAYFIIYEFMHMRYEVKGLAMSVLLPTLLLVWAIVAFFQEGNSWERRRELIRKLDARPANEAPVQQEGLIPKDTKQIDDWM